MKNIPEKIYLQIGENCDVDDFNDLCDVTWCKEKIFDNDLVYVLLKNNSTMDSHVMDEFRRLEKRELRWQKEADEANYEFEQILNEFDWSELHKLYNRLLDINVDLLDDSNQKLLEAIKLLLGE